MYQSISSVYYQFLVVFIYLSGGWCVKCVCQDIAFFLNTPVLKFIEKIKNLEHDSSMTLRDTAKFLLRYITL